MSESQQQRYQLDDTGRDNDANGNASVDNNAGGDNGKGEYYCHHITVCH